MGTDLFGKYYNNPTKSYIYTNMTCNGQSADEISFDISGDKGTISNNESVLSSIDLSAVHVPVYQYAKNMQVINPYDVIYINGFKGADSYMNKSFKINIKDIMEDEDWQYESSISFAMKYTDNAGVKSMKFFKGSGSYSKDVRCIDACQKSIDDSSVPVVISIDEDYISFTSLSHGYEFWIDNVAAVKGSSEYSAIYSDTDGYMNLTLHAAVLKKYNDNPTCVYIKGMKDSIKDTSTVYNDINGYLAASGNNESQLLFKIISELNRMRIIYDPSNNESAYTVDIMDEDISKYVPGIKYRNGAIKGIVIVPTYPEYNMTEYVKSLKLCPLRDRIKTTVCDSSSCTEKIYDVVCSFYSQLEYDEFVRCRKTLADENCDISISGLFKDVCSDVIGLYGFCILSSKNKLWTNLGQIFIQTAEDDDVESNVKNLNEGFLIYNPNSFPVVVNYMTFI